MNIIVFCILISSLLISSADGMSFSDPRVQQYHQHHNNGNPQPTSLSTNTGGAEEKPLSPNNPQEQEKKPSLWRYIGIRYLIAFAILVPLNIACQKLGDWVGHRSHHKKKKQA